MPYKVQFVGLVCFVRDHGGRTAFLPDGRIPPAGVEPHYGSIVVAPDSVTGAQGWPDQEGTSRGVYSFDPSSISIEGADVAGSLDTSGHDGLLPELRRINPDFTIDPSVAQTIGRLAIRQGTLRAYRIPGGTSVISELEVSHDGNTQITVTPDDGSAVRTIRLQPGTEIAITNMARGGYDRIVEENGHFQIYGKLSARRPIQLDEPLTVANVAPSPSQHVLFARKVPIGLSVSCSNTGCCSL